jgi:hypothetical protein
MMMVVGLGLWGKNIHNLLIKAIQMRFDARHVTKDRKKQEKLEKELERYARRHNIERIEEIQDKLNHTAEDATVHSHRLVTLDFLILYGIVKYCERFVQLLSKEEKELKRDEELFRAQKTLLKLIKKYELEEVDVKKKLKKVIAVIKDKLQEERGIILALEAVQQGKYGTRLAARETYAIKNRFYRYMLMRFEMIGARKSLQREEKDLRQLMPLIIHLDLVEQIHNKKTTKDIEKELEKIDKEENDFVKAVKKGSGNVHKLLVNDALVLRLILSHLFKEEIMDKRLAANHEIPLALAQADIEKKKRILKEVGKRLQDERQDILQIWGEIRQIKV